MIRILWQDMFYREKRTWNELWFTTYTLLFLLVWQLGVYYIVYSFVKGIEVQIPIILAKSAGYIPKCELICLLALLSAEA